MTSPSTAYEEPTFGQRLLARLVDGALVVAVLPLLGLLVEGDAESVARVALVAAYEALMVGRFGRTVGKAVLGTTILDRRRGGRPTVGQALFRSVALTAGPIIVTLLSADPAIGSIWVLAIVLPALLPPLHLGLHDMAAHTVVSSVEPVRQGT